jgi:hypothetical protein
MLPSRPISTTCMNIFGEVWIAHRSLGSLGTSSKAQTLRFNTPRSMQGLEAELHEHIRAITMFKHAVEYSVSMTNILLGLFDLEIKNK